MSAAPPLRTRGVRWQTTGVSRTQRLTRSAAQGIARKESPMSNLDNLMTDLDAALLSCSPPSRASPTSRCCARGTATGACARSWRMSSAGITNGDCPRAHRAGREALFPKALTTATRMHGTRSSPRRRRNASPRSRSGRTESQQGLFVAAALRGSRRDSSRRAAPLTASSPARAPTTTRSTHRRYANGGSRRAY